MLSAQDQCIDVYLNALNKLPLAFFVASYVAQRKRFSISPIRVVDGLLTSARQALAGKRFDHASASAVPAKTLSSSDLAGSHPSVMGVVAVHRSLLPLLQIAARAAHGWR